MNKNNLKTTILGALMLGLSVAGCGNSDSFVFTTSSQTNTAPVVPVPAPPVAVDDAFNALGNATVNFSAANGVLANDTVNGAQITAFDAVGSQSGTLVLNNDGSLTYSPLFGFVGAESFTYTLSNADGDSTATITFTSTGSGFFVNNQAAPGGDGSQASPFDTLNAALMAAGSGDTIYVFRGDGTPFAGGFTLADGVSLIGEGNGLVVAQQIEPVGTAPEIGGITLAGNNTVSGFLFTGNADAITADGVSNLTITNNTFQTIDGYQVDLGRIDGTVTVSDNLFEVQDNDQGLYLDNPTDTNTTVQVLNNTIRLLATGDGDGYHGILLSISGTSVMNATVSGNTVTGSGSGDDGMNFLYGMYIETYSTSSLTLALDDNTVTGVAGAGIYLDAYDSATFTGNGAGNTITNQPDDDGLYCAVHDSAVATFNLSGLVLSNIYRIGLNLDVDDNASLTASVTGSTISSNAAEGVFVDNNAGAGKNSQIRLALTNSTFSGIVDYAVAVVSQGGGNPVTCLDITGNTFNQNLDLSANSVTSVIDVEQLGSLQMLNTFVNPATVVTGGGGTINDRPDGFCSAP